MVALALVLVPLVAVGGAWVFYEDQIRRVLGWEAPNDYEGNGTGEVLIVIREGDIGEDVARTLHAGGVTRSFDAFYQLLLRQDAPVNFVPGTFALSEQMSAQAALDAILDPSNRVTSRFTVVEGTIVQDALPVISEALGVPVGELEAIIQDHEALGVPAEAPSIEGYLFPATYTLEPGMTPEAVIQLMVDRTMSSLDSLGVAEADRHRVVTIASLIEREAGTDEDFFRVSRVIQNRLDANMPLQFDSTSHYGAQSQGSVWTTDRERADDNPYNTYRFTGLPIGPIAAPGDRALEAAMNPAEGDWLYFVAVNLRTGESAFSNTLGEHERATERLREWCRESEENRAYCR